MEVFLTVRSLQNGTFTGFDATQIKEEDEMYLADVIYKAACHDDLRLDSQSYNHFFFNKAEGLGNVRVWKEEHKERVAELDNKFNDETLKYSQIYQMYAEKDSWVKSNYFLSLTKIPMIDAYIAKEVVLQVIYTAMKYGNCRDSLYFYNISQEARKNAEHKLLELELLSIEILKLKKEMQEKMGHTNVQ